MKSRLEIRVSTDPGGLDSPTGMWEEGAIVPNFYHIDIGAENADAEFANALRFQTYVANRVGLNYSGSDEPAGEEGGGEVPEALEQVAVNQYGKVYGEDYVLLGYRPGAEAIIKGLVSNIRKVYTVDSRGDFMDDIPMMANVNQVKDFDFLFSASAGYPGTVEWVQYAADPVGITMSTGTTSIQVNEVMPYVQSGQIKGILGGMPGAAEYESLIGQPGIGTSGMDAQSVAHVVIVLFIIFGNISFFIERRRSKKY